MPVKDEQTVAAAERMAELASLVKASAQITQAMTATAMETQATLKVEILSAPSLKAILV